MSDGLITRPLAGIGYFERESPLLSRHGFFGMPEILDQVGKKNFLLPCCLEEPQIPIPILIVGDAWDGDADEDVHVLVFRVGTLDHTRILHHPNRTIEEALRML